MPTSQTAADFTGIQSVATFKRVAKCVIGLAHKEIYHGKIPELTKWKGHAQDFNKSCLRELMKYARGMYPYSDRLSETGLALNWWRDIQSMQQEDAEILPVSILFSFNCTVTHWSRTFRYSPSSCFLFGSTPCLKGAPCRRSHGLRRLSVLQSKLAKSAHRRRLDNSMQQNKRHVKSIEWHYVSSSF